MLVLVRQDENRKTEEHESLPQYTHPFAPFGLGCEYEEAPWNIPPMSLTWLVFQVAIGWLNDFALSNIKLMSVTWLVFQVPIGWLNLVAFLNIPLMSVTWLVFHLEMSSLKFPANEDTHSIQWYFGSVWHSLRNAFSFFGTGCFCEHAHGRSE